MNDFPNWIENQETVLMMINIELNSLSVTLPHQRDGSHWLSRLISTNISARIPLWRSSLTKRSNTVQREQRSEKLNEGRSGV